MIPLVQKKLTPIFVENLKKLMEEHKYTEYKVAQKSGINFSSINRIISGKTKRPSMSTVDRIASVFGLTIANILTPIPLKGKQISIPVYHYIDGSKTSMIEMSYRPAKFAISIKISPHESKIPSDSTLVFIDDLYQDNDIVVERELNDCFTFHLVRKVNDVFYLFDLKEQRKCIGRLEDFNIQGVLSEIRTSKILRT